MRPVLHRGAEAVEADDAEDQAIFSDADGLQNILIVPQLTWLMLYLDANAESLAQTSVYYIQKKPVVLIPLHHDYTSYGHTRA